MQETAARLIALCRQRRVSLCTAESCTGGMIAETLTAVSGASEVFLGSLVTYDERMKEKWLGVSPETLRGHGAVSADCAREMALGARRASGADVALSVTGFAGPGGGTERDPVGTVYLAVAQGDVCECVKRRFSGDREAVRRQACDTALSLLLLAVEQPS
ncbi:MAG: CinA family protein [Clostridia bacterium]|nr:CinA family protein [Clostridia bacterium]